MLTTWLRCKFRKHSKAFWRIQFLIHLFVCILFMGWVLYYHNYSGIRFTFSSEKNEGDKRFVKGGKSHQGNSYVGTQNDRVARFLPIFNKMGGSWTTIESFEAIVADEDNLGRFEKVVHRRLVSINMEIQASSPQAYKDRSEADLHRIRRMYGAERKEKLVLATVACGESRVEAITMLKSAAMFSQHADLHLIIFSDMNTILALAQDILELKWTVNKVGWDFTFELFLDWFPDPDKIPWKQMWRPCSTQRLFFPSLLPDVDSLIYIDADTIILANLSTVWDHFNLEMKDNNKLIAVSRNSQPSAKSYYGTSSKIPFLEPTGLNAGVMLMNLTRMRSFNFEEKAISAYNIYKEKIALADQDIINIIGHFYPEKVLVINCTFNLHWAYCGFGPARTCYNHQSYDGPICFCDQTSSNGVHILHGNMLTFQINNFPFIKEIYWQFSQFEFLKDTFSNLFVSLQKHFSGLETPCFSLTGQHLYMNAQQYFTFS